MEEKKEYTIEEIKKEIIGFLESEGMEKQPAYYAFLQFGVNTQNEWFMSLDKEVRSKFGDLIQNINFGVLAILDEYSKDDVKEDFDVWFFSRNIASQICEEEKIEETDENVEFITLLVTSIFRMWYLDYDVQDVIQFFKGESKKEFPNLSDNAYNCKWAMEAGLSCSDATSMFDMQNFEGMIDEEGKKNAMDMMEHMESLFLGAIPHLAEGFKDFDKEFVEANIEDCKVLFMLTNLMFAQIPKGQDAAKLMETEERMESAYTGYMEMCAGQGYKERFLGENKKKFFVVFCASYMLCMMQETMKAGMFPDGHGTIYEEMTNMKVDALNKKKEDKNEENS